MLDAGRSTQLERSKRLVSAAMKLEYRLKRRFTDDEIKACFDHTKDALTRLEEVFNEHAAKNSPPPAPADVDEAFR